jgi:hypothetical protein
MASGSSSAQGQRAEGAGAADGDGQGTVLHAGHRRLDDRKLDAEDRVRRCHRAASADRRLAGADPARELVPTQAS